MANANGAAVKATGYVVQYVDGKEERVEGDGMTFATGVVLITAGQKIVLVAVLQNVRSVRPVYES